MKFKTLSCLIVVLLAMSAQGAEKPAPVKFSSGGISYESLTDSTVQVTGTTLTNVVDIPETVEFSGTDYKVTVIGSSSFRTKQNVHVVSLPSTIVKIDDDAFYGCSVSDLRIKEGLTTIESYAFYSTEYLTSVELPSTVSKIGPGAFSSSAICEISIPEGVMDIESSTFSQCKSLTSIRLPESLKTIGTSSFYGCISLKEITLPAGIVKIEHSAFSGCSMLKGIKIPPLVSTIEMYTFQNCVSLENIELPTNLLTINSHAFDGCKKLKVLSFPLKTNKIEQNAFRGCGLTDIFIPESVQSIHTSTSNSGIFSKCDKIQNVHVRWSNPKSLGEKMFVEKDTLDDIKRTPYVPAGTKDLYAAIDTYKVFDEIVEESISLEMETRIRMIAGTVSKLNPKVSPAIFPLGSLDWKSSNKEAATVDAYGNINALKKRE